MSDELRADEVFISPWIPPECCKNMLTVLVLSSNVNIIENIAEGLIEVHSKASHRWKLSVLRSLSLNDVIKQVGLTGQKAIDFIVLALDTSRYFCLEWVKKEIQQIHPDFRARRIILVNAIGLPINRMSVCSEELLTLISELNVDIVSANVLDKNNVTFLAQKLLKFIEVTIGIKTGMPNLNV